MTKDELEFEFTETCEGELDHPEVYASISKDAVKTLFEEAGQTLSDESYVQGEVQFIFDSDGTTLDEILIFPVYDDGDSMMNGDDFIDAPDSFWDYEDDARTQLNNGN